MAYLLEVAVLTFAGFGVATLLAWLYLLSRLLAGLPPPIPIAPPHEQSSESVTAIVPMRNESSNAEGCIRPLLSQPNVKRVVAVDDCSSDGTGDLLLRLSSSDEKVTVVKPDAVPEGWVGKSYACQVGSERAGDADWLLFVDADTRLSPEAVSKALAYAERGGLDACSLFGRFRCPNVWDRLSTPFFFGLLNSFITAKEVNDPRRKEAYFFGSFILIRREKYLAMGGHSKVASEVVEDKALGEVAKGSGLKIGIGYAPSDVSAEWAPGFGNSVKAIMRVTAPSMRRSPRIGTVYSFGLSALVLLPIASVLLGALVGTSYDVYLLILLCGLASLGIELCFTAVAARKVGVSTPYALGFVPASLVCIVALWRSLSRAWSRKQIEWRGRAYRL
jgi:hypothetical protein